MHREHRERISLHQQMAEYNLISLERVEELREMDRAKDQSQLDRQIKTVNNRSKKRRKKLKNSQK